MIRVKKLSIEVERNGSVLKTEYCSCTGPEFSAQYPQSGVPTAPVTPAIADLMPFSEPRGHLHSHMHINNPPTYIHITKRKINLCLKINIETIL